jgi:hypothetical protein
MKKVYAIVFLSICFWWVHSQYYYFDTGTTSYPYQQGCNESLLVRVSTETHVDWAKAGRLHLVLDPQHILYSTSDVRNTLFEASTQTFQDWSSESSPSWKSWSSFSILQIDRKNNLNAYKWLNGLYWTISFVPRYVVTSYSSIFGMEYNGEIGTSTSTIETTLSSPWGTEIINPTRQFQFMTWTYVVLQQPCVDDTQIPNISLTTPINWAIKQTYLSWISLSLTDIGGSSSDVPYVWTGGNTWTGNSRAIDTQYGINISTLQITLSGNGQTRIFTSWTYATPSAKTWQFLDKNYNVSISSGVLFDYGIEKRIDLSVQVRDRKWLQRNVSYNFNNPQGPMLIAGTRFPVVGATFVNYDAPIRFGVEDDWAGVNSGSIVVTLSGINGTSYGPYVFSGNMLNLSGLSSTALQPNWMVEVSNHVDFPASWTIRVRVAVRDMVGNQWTISDYSFVTRQSCSQLGCCDDKYIQYKNISSLFARNTFTVQGGLNPVFSVSVDGTWYIDCGLTNQGMFIYKGTELESGSAQSVGFLDLSNLRIMGNNVKAVLSWSTLVLQKIFDHWSLDWWGWWWWIFLHKDNCPGGDDSYSYYDGICESDAHSAGDICPVEGDEYSQELVDAFQFAYGLGVTTMCPIDAADMTWNLSRKHLAKMITEYAVTIVGLYPDITKTWCDMYDDMDDQSSEMKFYSKIVCQLWLMGLESDGIEPLKSFHPNEVVTRAQFGTILSRLIFGDAYNIKERDTDIWYQKHLNALKENKIMNKIENPEMIEMRWRVMLMLQRTFETWIIDRYRMLHNANNSIRIIYDF